MNNTEDEARRVFGARAAFYATSSAHADQQVLSRVVAIAAPESHWDALDIATGAGHTAFAVSEHVRRVAATYRALTVADPTSPPANVQISIYFFYQHPNRG
jgi:ubiquinone/menaquinone biosynthesis C-methylase UbiE